MISPTTPIAPPIPTDLSLNGSRLIRLLTELVSPAPQHSFKDFGRRFGQLFALSDSIKLADMHGGLARTRFEPRQQAPGTIEAEFLRVQKTIIDSLSRRFVDDSEQVSSRDMFPALRPQASPEQLSSYEPYQGFYVNLQRYMEREVHHLQSASRDAVAGLSPQLAQLVTIDTTLGDTLTAHSRKLLALVPQLLGQRFEFLRQQWPDNAEQAIAQDSCDTWLASGGWLHRFRLDTHDLLLAELDLRLQPILGLIEAANEACDNSAAS